MKILAFFTIFNWGFFSFSGFGAQNNIDSVKSLLNISSNDTGNLGRLIYLSQEYHLAGLYDSSMFFANRALSLSNKLLANFSDSANYSFAQDGKASSYNNIGLAYYALGNYSLALKNHSASLQIREKTGDKKGLAFSYNNIGNVFYAQSIYPEALKNHFLSLKIKEEVGDSGGIAASYNNIGNVYYLQNNFKEALKNYFASLKIRQLLGKKKGIGNAYNNIGIVYDDLGNYDEALEFLFLSLKIKNEIGDKAGIGDAYNNIGSIYTKKEKFSEAIQTFYSALKIYNEIGLRAGTASALSNIGNAFTRQKKFKEAGEYLEQARTLAIEIGANEYLKSTYKSITELDSARGDYKGAYENHKLYILYRDSMDNEETRKKTIQSQMTYDFEKKEAIEQAEHKKEMEKQQALAGEKSRKQKIIIAFVGGGLLLVLVFAGYVFRNLRVTRKQKDIIEGQKKLVEKQKQEVEQQKHLVEETQREIISSITYAKRLQNAILPPVELIKEKLPESFVLYHPKDIVAGDFFWMHMVTPSRLENFTRGEIIFIAAADSTGHGVPGAMVSVVCSNALNRAVNEFNLKETGKILDKTRELVLETFAKSDEEIKDGMDISLLGIFLPDPMGRADDIMIQWSGANNPLWYFDSTEKFIEIKADKQPIGKTEKPKDFTTHKINFKKGEINKHSFYLMTDGFADQFGGPKGKKYKYKQLEEKIISINKLPAIEQEKILKNLFYEWQGNLEQVDDVTIIGIRI